MVVEVVNEDLWIHDVAEQVILRWLAVNFLGKLGLHCYKVNRFSQATRPNCDRRVILQDNLLQLLRETAIWLSQVTRKKVYDRIGEVDVLALGKDVVLIKVVLNHEDCHVANHFRAGRHLDNIAKQLVNFPVLLFN